MTEFSEGHSTLWLALMQAYQQYRIAVLNWVKEADLKEMAERVDTSRVGFEMKKTI